MPIPLQYLLLIWALGITAAAPVTAAPAARVRVAQPVLQQVAPTTTLAGVIDFDRISQVSGEVAGLVTRQYAREGALLKAGDTVLELNSDLLQKDIDIKRKQQAQLAADLSKSTATLQRLERLLKKNSASRQTYDDALYSHRSLQEKREILGQELLRLQLRLKKSRILAPFDGLVLARLKEEGEWMSPGDAAFQLASTEHVIIKLPISEQLIRYQRPGQPLTVTIEPLQLQLQGETIGFLPVSALRSRSSTLKIAIPYRPGMAQNMSARVELPSGKPQRLLMIPRDALVQKQGKNSVFTPVDGKATQLPVTVVSRGTQLVGITLDQLQQTMPVVVDGNDRLRPGQSVEIIAP